MSAAPTLARPVRSSPRTPFGFGLSTWRMTRTWKCTGTPSACAASQNAIVLRADRRADARHGVQPDAAEPELEAALHLARWPPRRRAPAWRPGRSGGRVRPSRTPRRASRCRPARRPGGTPDRGRRRSGSSCAPSRRAPRRRRRRRPAPRGAASPRKLPWFAAAKVTPVQRTSSCLRRPRRRCRSAPAGCRARTARPRRRRRPDTTRGAFSWNFFGMYSVQRWGGSRTWESAEISRYSRAIWRYLRRATYKQTFVRCKRAGGSPAE